MDFKVDGRKVTLIFGVRDVSFGTIAFKNHRDFIKYHFKQKGFEITKWNWDLDPETGKWRKYDDGIEFKTTDSQIDMLIEVTGEIGKNIREFREDAKGIIIQP